jgi:prevent-host-death family protein
MTLHRRETEVRVRELHNRLSEYLERVENGTDVVVTRRGKRIARLSAVSYPEGRAALAAARRARRLTQAAHAQA